MVSSATPSSAACRQQALTRASSSSSLEDASTQQAFAAASAAAAAGDSLVSVTACFVSGRFLATVQLRRNETVAALRKALQTAAARGSASSENSGSSPAERGKATPRSPAASQRQAACSRRACFALTFGDSVLRDSQTVSSAGLSDGSIVTVVLVQALTRFDGGMVSGHVEVSADGLVAKHRDATGEELFGVVFGSEPLPRLGDGAYFEVRILETRSGDQMDGLVVGVTTSPPQAIKTMPRVADEVPHSWSLGYDGMAYLDGMGTVDIDWDPARLQRDDRVGLLVTPRGDLLVMVNDKLKAHVPANVPPYSTLYGFIDLLGSTSAVTLVLGAVPHPEVVRQGKSAARKKRRSSKERKSRLPAQQPPADEALQEEEALAADEDNGGDFEGYGAQGMPRGLLDASMRDALRRPFMSGLTCAAPGEHIRLSPNGSAVRRHGSGSEEFYGVVLGNAPLPSCEEGRYFEVKIDHVLQGEEYLDGLAIGFTATPPEGLANLTRPACACEVQDSWLAGYNGTFLNCSDAEDAVTIAWQPVRLKPGDRVGALATHGGDFVVFENGMPVVSIPAFPSKQMQDAGCQPLDMPPLDVPLYALIDIIGNTRGVTFLMGAYPPDADRVLERPGGLSVALSAARAAVDVAGAATLTALDAASAAGIAATEATAAAGVNVLDAAARAREATSEAPTMADALGLAVDAVASGAGAVANGAATAAGRVASVAVQQGDGLRRSIISALPEVGSPADLIASMPEVPPVIAGHLRGAAARAQLRERLAALTERLKKIPTAANLLVKTAGGSRGEAGAAESVDGAGTASKQQTAESGQRAIEKPRRRKKSPPE
eukprot:TRINITY_DN58754_c0_g1_i1.p1 TRINITY_DN58754_c0_g1~~TRINITY_DN58754_c0_g1_i1.p1  ORF type:complete len:832 (-),score=187.85 TRINITY_DN58754_c0_g1_i1:212-2707(-)